jgi:hypothetical protein
MSSGGFDAENSGMATPNSNSPRILDFSISVNREMLRSFKEQVRQVVKETVREELSAQRPKPSAEKQDNGVEPARDGSAGAVRSTAAEAIWRSQEIECQPGKWDVNVRQATTGPSDRLEVRC